MAKNDYYVLVYKILMYLYNCLKSGEEVDTGKLTANWLGINDRYFEYIFDTLKDEGFILDVAYIEDYAGKRLDDGIMISPKGISYLHENSTIQKVKRSVKGITDIVGNITPL